MSTKNSYRRSQDKLMVATTVNLSTDSLGELIEVSLSEYGQGGHCLGGGGGLFG